MKSLQILMMGNNNNGLVEGYGYLYNGFAALDVNFTPTDWEIPTVTQMTTLIGESTGLEAKYKGSFFWNTANGTNATGWSALGSGKRSELGVFSDLKDIFYLSLEESSSTRINLFTLADSGTRSIGTIPLKQTGLSVRLIYTGAGTPSSMTDYDGNVYNVVKIGTQYWTVQNWKCTHLNDGTALTKVTDATAWAALTTEGYCSYNNDDSYV